MIHTGPQLQHPAPRRRWLDTAWGLLRGPLLAILLVLLIHQFLVTQFYVDGHSMDPTLASGERLLINRVVYDFGTPKRGDIVVFRAPVAGDQDWVKRVIGLPGDTIAVTDGKLIVNGRIIAEPFIAQPMNPRHNFGPVRVPPGELFVMGDNRNVSVDSRVIGPIAITSVIGRVDLIFWPLKDFKVLGAGEEKLLPQWP
ncbi:MAG: signal peptidase I [Firmicutes bacterium]|nr:signal peptidase I [Bacillota bacterium]